VVDLVLPFQGSTDALLFEVNLQLTNDLQTQLSHEGYLDVIQHIEQRLPNSDLLLETHLPTTVHLQLP
jgi:hypothetical protein